MNVVKRASVALLGMLAFCAAFVQTAVAAVPVAASTAITEIQTDGLAMVDLLWPVIGALTVAFVLIKIFKKGGNKVG